MSARQAAHTFAQLKRATSRPSRAQSTCAGRHAASCTLRPRLTSSARSDRLRVARVKPYLQNQTKKAGADSFSLPAPNGEAKFVGWGNRLKRRHLRRLASALRTIGCCGGRRALHALMHVNAAFEPLAYLLLLTIEAAKHRPIVYIASYIFRARRSDLNEMPRAGTMTFKP